MTATSLIILVVVLVAIALVVFMLFRERSRKLRSRFGPEYDRVVQQRGSTLTAERELEHRAKRVENFHIHPLAEADREKFAHEWRITQEKFVDDPRGALADADRLVHSAMKARGFPIGGEFVERAADLSVEHPRVVDHYRAGHEIAVRDERAPVSTEDLRLAMKHYRALFEDLLGRHVGEMTGARK